ncbi:MAG: hypothetical protein HC780_01155 [Leptolyngbyaceae cyanobacterium CSU_1_3]|nr:hypothetical protein [Leptolyngbyaceae cyanobacterium CSU_1_3]
MVNDWQSVAIAPFKFGKRSLGNVSTSSQSTPMWLPVLPSIPIVSAYILVSVSYGETIHYWDVTTQTPDLEFLAPEPLQVVNSVF